ncbi:hypothetical protein HPP92_011419 [Vanilla planifolia]|uniref:Uncharacterized protein n=1 Tax=Vanilla planifolia TaxID=51239 RepID=A0A835R0T3_VANPL|nr:hypothetical protein HPP92_011419 [Vanilla planifolia]
MRRTTPKTLIASLHRHLSLGRRQTLPLKAMDPPPQHSSPIHVVSTLSSPHDGTIDASLSTRKPISLWPGMYHSPVTKALWEARSCIFERLLDPSMDRPPQIELLNKTPAQSRTNIVYNFSSDYILREQYRDPWNEVRFGKLLEDLDALAGTIAVKRTQLKQIPWPSQLISLLLHVIRKLENLLR